MQRLLILLATILFGMWRSMSRAYAVFDSLVLFRDGTANLTVTENGTSIDFKAALGLITGNAVVRVSVPQATGTTPTFDLKIQESDDNATWKDLITFDQITTSGNYRRHIQSVRRYLRHVATIGGTGPSFGKVLIAIDSGDQQLGTQKQ